MRARRNPSKAFERIKAETEKAGGWVIPWIGLGKARYVIPVGPWAGTYTVTMAPPRIIYEPSLKAQRGKQERWVKETIAPWITLLQQAEAAVKSGRLRRFSIEDFATRLYLAAQIAGVTRQQISDDLFMEPKRFYALFDAHTPSRQSDRVKYFKRFFATWSVAEAQKALMPSVPGYPPVSTVREVGHELVRYAFGGTDREALEAKWGSLVVQDMRVDPASLRESLVQRYGRDQILRVAERAKAAGYPKKDFQQLLIHGNLADLHRLRDQLTQEQ